MDFERKAEVEGLLAKQDPDMQVSVLESEAAPVLADDKEPGAIPHVPADREKPDETALSHYMDDLVQFERDHAGESDMVEAVDKLKSALLDDLAAGDRERAFGNVSAADEQYGMVADFHADLALEGAAIATPGDDGPYLVSTAGRGAFDEDDEYGWGGGGGGGGGGNPPPSDGGGGGGGDAPPEDPSKTKAGAKSDEPKKKGIWPFGRKDKATDAPPPSDKPDKGSK